MRSIIVTVFAATMVSVASLAASDPATASTMTYQITFAAGSIPAIPAVPNPDIVLGQFDIALDTSVDTPISQTAGISLDFLNLTFDSPLSYIYSKASDALIVGAAANGAGMVQALTHDFLLEITSIAAGTPHFGSFTFADGSSPGLFDAGTGTVHVSTIAATPVVAATPLPGALPFLVTALGGLGFVGWRRSA